MTHLPPARFAPLLLAAALVLLAGCGKEPAAGPEASGPGARTAGPRPGTPAGTPVASIPGPGSAETTPALAVTAEQLAKDFLANDREAETKYKGRWLVVEGLCKEANERNTGGTVSRLFYFKDYTEPVNRVTVMTKCAVDEAHWPGFDGLTPGQKVKVKARCAGAASQVVSLEQGELVKADDDPAVAVPASRLAGEFAAGRDAARRDYNGKWLLVEGTVQDTSTKDPWTITLDGSTDKTKGGCVVARFPMERQTDPAKVKKGDRVKLKGKAMLYADDSNVVLDECKLVK